MRDDERGRAFDMIWELRARDDVDAIRTLVEFLDAGDDSVALEAARALGKRDVPDDLRERVAAAFLADDPTREYAFHLGARALVVHPRAVEILEPLLRIDVVAADAARRRARTILFEIEDQLARCSDERDARRPDPRFRELAAEIRRLDPELDHATQQIEAAYRFFDGERVAPEWCRVYFADEYLPVVIVGFRRGYHGDIPTDLGTAYPPGITVIDHQYAGYSCNQETVFGYVVAVSPAEPLGVALADLTNAQYGTYGEAMSPDDLAVWRARFAPLLGADLVESYEGVTTAAGHPSALCGRTLVRYGTEFAPWRYGIDLHEKPDIVEAGTFGDEHLRALANIAERYTLSPCTILLTENCD